MGTRFVHLWTAAWATVIVVTATRILRSNRAPAAALRLVVTTLWLLASVATPR